MTPRICTLEGSAGGLTSTSITSTGRFTNITTGVGNTFRVRTSMAPSTGNVTNVRVSGGGHRHALVCFSVGRNGMIVSEARDNLDSFNGRTIPRSVRLT